MNKLIVTKFDEALLLLRVAFGSMMAFGHGLPKMQNFEKMSGAFADPFGMGSTLSLIMAIGAEFGCSLLLILGLGTRLAALPLIVTMLVAVFYAHGADPWKVKELGVTYLVVYLVILIAGPGRYSLDAKLFGRSPE